MCVCVFVSLIETRESVLTSNVGSGCVCVSLIETRESVLTSNVGSGCVCVKKDFWL